MRTLKNILLDKDFILIILTIIFIILSIIWKADFKNNCIKNDGKLVKNSNFTYGCIYERNDN